MKLEKAIASYEKTLKQFPDCADGHALYAQVTGYLKPELNFSYNRFHFGIIINEPLHKKTNKMLRRKQRRRSACNREADHRLWFGSQFRTFEVVQNFNIKG